jgi:hypothetical protein
MSERLSEIRDRAKLAAKVVGLDAVTQPDLLSAQFRGGSDSEEVLKGPNLPLEAQTLTIGRFPVIFGRLPDSADVALVRDSVRRYRNQCVVAKSHMSPERSLDLQLWLVAPDGSDGDSAWIAIAAAIERDDRVCRKLVWLPPVGNEGRTETFSVFVSRTFLARPWAASQSNSFLQLDRLSSPASLAGDLGIQQSVLDRWFELAQDTDFNDGAELVDKLVEAWPEGPL